jgi:THO complex subunit 2
VCLSALSSTWIKYSFILQPSWVTDEEFGNGYLDSKPAPSLTSKPSAGNSGPAQSSSVHKLSQSETAGGKTVATATQHSDSGNSVKDQILKTKPADGRSERTESVTIAKPDPGIVKQKVGLLVNGSDAQSSLPSATIQSGTSRSTENPRQVDESTRTLDENMAKVAPKNSTESEVLSEILSLI